MKSKYMSQKSPDKSDSEADNEGTTMSTLNCLTASYGKNRPDLMTDAIHLGRIVRTWQSLQQPKLPALLSPFLYKDGLGYVKGEMKTDPLAKCPYIKYYV
ncbi:hypothetical protein Bca4012_061187 [Brassica carinata]